MAQYHVSRFKLVRETVLVVADTEEEALEYAMEGHWSGHRIGTIRADQWETPELKSKYHTYSQCDLQLPLSARKRTLCGINIEKPGTAQPSAVYNALTGEFFDEGDLTTITHTAMCKTCLKMKVKESKNDA